MEKQYVRSTELRYDNLHDWVLVCNEEYIDRKWTLQQIQTELDEHKTLLNAAHTKMSEPIQPGGVKYQANMWKPMRSIHKN